MNKKMKRRLALVSGIIVIVIILLLAFAGAGTTAKTITIGEALSGDYDGDRVQVTGNVLKDSYSTSNDVLTFTIYDPDDTEKTLPVSYDGSVSSTFGNDVTAICTGKLDESGTLVLSELVTKCPSKYEQGTSALSVSKLLSYSKDKIVGTMVKVAGTVKEGTLTAAGSDPRFVLEDGDDKDASVDINFDDALSEEVAEGTSVVITGSLNKDGSFDATEVALESDS